jgi:hypothetical protein
MLWIVIIPAIITIIIIGGALLYLRDADKRFRRKLENEAKIRSALYIKKLLAKSERRRRSRRG